MVFLGYTLSELDSADVVEARAGGRCVGRDTIGVPEEALALTVRGSTPLLTDTLAGAHPGERIELRAITQGTNGAPSDTLRMRPSLVECHACSRELVYEHDAMWIVDSVQLRVLPVELTRFVAIAGEGSAVLEWQTASEKNNAGFEVQHEKRTNGAQEGWEEIAFVEGAGTAEEPQTYRYQVRDLLPGRHSFRLVQVDYDGERTFSPTVTAEIQGSFAFELYPVPASDRVTLAVYAPEEKVTAEVFDLLGRKVEEHTVEAGGRAKEELETSHLSSGVYLVRLGDEVRRMVIAR